MCLPLCISKGESYGNLCGNILSLFLRKMLMSAFLSRFKANYLEKMPGYPYFSLWIPIALGKFYFSVWS